MGILKQHSQIGHKKLKKWLVSLKSKCWVSILVLVDVVLEGSCLNCLPFQFAVSILVLVDVVLEVRRAKSH